LITIITKAQEVILSISVSIKFFVRQYIKLYNTIIFNKSFSTFFFT